MTNVISLTGEPVEDQKGEIEPDAGTILLLERALADAQAGELMGAVLIRQHSDTMVSSAYAGRIMRFAVVGAIEHTKLAILNEP